MTLNNEYYPPPSHHKILNNKYYNFKEKIAFFLDHNHGDFFKFYDLVEKNIHTKKGFA